MHVCINIYVCWSKRHLPKSGYGQNRFPNARSHRPTPPKTRPAQKLWPTFSPPSHPGDLVRSGDPLVRLLQRIIGNDRSDIARPTHVCSVGTSRFEIRAHGNRGRPKNNRKRKKMIESSPWNWIGFFLRLSFYRPRSIPSESVHGKRRLPGNDRRTNPPTSVEPFANRTTPEFAGNSVHGHRFWPWVCRRDR